MADKTPEPKFYYKRDDKGRPVTTVCLIEVTNRIDGIRYAYGSTTCGKNDLSYLLKGVGRRIAEQRAKKVLELVPLYRGPVYEHRSDMKLLAPEDLSPLERSLFNLDKPEAKPLADLGQPDNTQKPESG